jgi:putative PIN family toxin of toxin-antitoxin system
MIRVVMDTNVIVSALMSSNGTPARILALIFYGEIQIYYSDGILTEYEDVLSRPALKIKPEKIKRFFEIIREAGTPIMPTASNMPLPDESDRIFYDTARESNAILITGNTKHYPTEDIIMTPSQFWGMLHNTETMQA